VYSTELCALWYFATSTAALNPWGAEADVVKVEVTRHKCQLEKNRPHDVEDRTPAPIIR
jgi:hypothetical protein